MDKTDWILLILVNLVVALYCFLGFVDAEGMPLVLTFTVIANIVYFLVVSRENDRP